jgi:hypothetical protein
MRSRTMNDAVTWMRARNWTITSEFRDEGSHRFGAIDFGARGYPQGSLAETGVHGCRHPRAAALAKRAQLAFPHLAVYLESDHVHIHDPSALPRSLGHAPAPGIEITSQCGNATGARKFVRWKNVSFNRPIRPRLPSEKGDVPCACHQCTPRDDRPYSALFKHLNIQEPI